MENFQSYKLFTSAFCIKIVTTVKPVETEHWIKWNPV